MAHGRISLGLAAAALLLPMQPGAQADTGAKIVEEVDFATSCSPPCSKTFKHAAWTLHSFWYPEALKDFTAVTEAEPDCAIGYWGIAMSHWYPLWFPPSPAALKAGSEAVAKARRRRPKTEREKDYIAAIAAFYRDNDKVDHSTRAVAYEKAMEQVYPKYPDDREAGVFYALALNTTALPTDKTYANKKKAAEILNKVWKDQPNHPGVVHYLIHSDDSAQFAQAGLGGDLLRQDRARGAACAAHAVAHLHPARHVAAVDRTRTARPMTRRSPTSKRRSGRAATTARPSTRWTTWNTPICRPRRTARPKRSSMSCSLSQERRRRTCRPPTPSRRSRRATRSSAATGRWRLRCRTPAIGFPLEQIPMGRGDDLVRPRARRRAHRRTSPARRPKSPNCNRSKTSSRGEGHVLGQPGRGPAPGRRRHARACPGDDKKAVELVRAAADLEATMDKHPATPAPVLPARELLADLLLELNEPAAALTEYKEIAADRSQPVPQHPRQGARRQAGGRRRGRARRLSEAGGAEQTRRAPSAPNWPRPRPI